MGSLYRSEEMALCQLFLQSESAYACVSELGELGLVQFRDLNPDVTAFQRKFVNEVRRCEEMERKLRYLEKEIKKDKSPIFDSGDSPPAPAPKEMIDLEATFEKLENELKEVNSNTEALKRNYLELTELKHILRKATAFFEENEGNIIEDAQQAVMDHTGTEHSNLGFVAGVILRERMPAFERMLWRACRGNVFLKQAEIETNLADPVSGDEVRKSVFIIFFQGDQLKSRVKKICEGFRATLYPCPETPLERREMATGVMTRIEDLTTVLSQTEDHRHRVLVAAAKNIRVWFIKVCKIKAIYHILNMFNLDVTNKCLIAECWIAVVDLDRIQMALRKGAERSGSSVPSILNRMKTKTNPPTYNRTNRFTNVFQNIVDAYGVASYREANPAPFTIITFPFLFSVMFGDTGHGLLLFVFALWMVIMEKKFEGKYRDNEIWTMFFGGRYIILLMGLMSIHSGFLYNDIFSKSMNIFKSSWSARTFQNTSFTENTLMSLDPVNPLEYSGSPYPFGIDPVWQGADNKITFLNTYKMKMSVILGIMQMIFGVVVGLTNHRFFRRPLNIFCEFIPQLIFLVAIFFYLVVIIFYKWIFYKPAMSNEAPSLLIHFINMFLMSYPNPDDPAISKSVTVFYPGQKEFQTFLVLLALLCIPWMLLTKPIIMCITARKDQHVHSNDMLETLNVPEDAREAQEDHNENHEKVKKAAPIRKPEPPQHGGGGGGGHGDDDGPFDFGEVFVKQCIHTIEYCLGCVSHTASYLRLWALSLAHAKLSEVLWTMVFVNGLSVSSIVGCVVVFVLFTPWAVLTVGVLLVMEGLSAFLHTLRLHWVEFQSKFYVGEGYLFEPYSFDLILNASTDTEAAA